ncbi:hypothetical protein EC968_006615 [Mortierella alpina]|nr:hypothetical protein EC968_006615 [Mortierella alpina]
MKVLWSRLTSVTVIAMAVALSHLNLILATNTDHDVGYVQDRNYNYVDGFQDSLDQQDDGSVAITAMDYEQPHIPGVNSKYARYRVRI